MYILRELANIRTDFLTQVFRLFTVLGEELVVLGILCTLYWCFNKRLAYRICFAYFVSGIVIQTLKITFRIDRPWLIDKNFRPVESALKASTGYSFPSGHTQTATALYGSLACNTKKVWLRVISIFLILGVAFSRMYLGVHTLRDVLTSLMVSSILVVFLNYTVVDQLLDQKKKTISLFILCLSFAAIAYASILLRLNIVENEYAKDLCKAGGAGIGFSIGWYIESKFIRFSERACMPPLQVLKCFLGITVAILIKSGLKIVLGESIPAEIVRHILLVLWVLVLFPLCINKFFSYKKVIRLDN